VPGPEADANLLIRWSSKLTHIALYVLALGMPLTGAIAW
jgi:cytochrome b561